MLRALGSAAGAGGGGDGDEGLPPLDPVGSPPPLAQTANVSRLSCACDRHHSPSHQGPVSLPWEHTAFQQGRRYSKR